MSRLTIKVCCNDGKTERKSDKQGNVIIMVAPSTEKPAGIYQPDKNVSHQNFVECAMKRYNFLTKLLTLILSKKYNPIL